MIYPKHSQIRYLATWNFDVLIMGQNDWNDRKAGLCSQNALDFGDKGLGLFEGSSQYYIW